MQQRIAIALTHNLISQCGCHSCRKTHIRRTVYFKQIMIKLSSICAFNIKGTLPELIQPILHAIPPTLFSVNKNNKERAESKDPILSEKDNNSPYLKTAPEASIAATAECDRSFKPNII